MAIPSAKAISSEFPFVKKQFQINSDCLPPWQSHVLISLAKHHPLRLRKVRCIAPDLIGYGDSGKVSNIAYRVSDHQRYLDAFLDAVLPREKLILVVHDWGSALGFDWARRHEDRVAGLAFMEFLPPTESWNEFSRDFTRMFSQFRDPQLGRELLINQNLFIEKVLQSGILRTLSEEEMNEYRRPFVQPQSREPLYRFPNELPIEGQPKETWEMAQKYMAWLFENDLPKLFFWVTPATFVGEARAQKFIAKFRNTRSVYLGRGLHFVQEDHPHTIGRELADWLPLNPAGLL